MKKVLFLILALSILLCACTPSSTQPETAPVAETAAPTAVPETTTVPTTLPADKPTETLPEPDDADFVRVIDYLPSVSQELMYATDRNFTGQIIYDFTDAYLRYGTVKKLAAVSEDLAEFGLALKIWDGFRPVSAQRKLWEVCPDPAYVANPNKGFSSHSRGNTVDLTLVDTAGNEVEMPTGFDDFSAKADRNYADCTEAAAAHAQMLEILMEKHGFSGYFQEWWHFSDTDAYPVEENFAPPANN